MKTDILNNFSYILNKKSKSILIFIFFLLLGLILFLIIAFKYEYNKYISYYGYINKLDKYYVSLYVKEDELSNLNNSELLIENNKYDFKIISIDKYYNFDNLYYQVILDLNLKEEWLVENNIISITLKTPYTTLYKEMKGLDLWN